MANSPRSKPASTKSTPKPAPKPTALERAPVLEWIAAAVGLVLSLGAIGVLGVEALHGDDAPPALAATAGPITRTAAGYYVEVRLNNTGRVTASRVEVEGALQSGGSDVETAALTFDFLPEGSERTGGLYFERDPARHSIALRIKGQVDP